MSCKVHDTRYEIKNKTVKSRGKVRYSLIEL